MVHFFIRPKSKFYVFLCVRVCIARTVFTTRCYVSAVLAMNIRLCLSVCDVFNHLILNNGDVPISEIVRLIHAAEIGSV